MQNSPWNRTISPIIGVEYIIEISRLGEESLYLCALCLTRERRRTITSHLSHIRHKLIYLEKFYPQWFQKFYKQPDISKWSLMDVKILDKFVDQLNGIYDCPVKTVVAPDEFVVRKDSILMEIERGPHSYDKNIRINSLFVPEPFSDLPTPSGGVGKLQVESSRAFLNSLITNDSLNIKSWDWQPTEENKESSDSFEVTYDRKRDQKFELICVESSDDETRGETTTDVRNEPVAEQRLIIREEQNVTPDTTAHGTSLTMESISTTDSDSSQEQAHMEDPNHDQNRTRRNLKSGTNTRGPDTHTESISVIECGSSMEQTRAESSSSSQQNEQHPQNFSDFDLHRRGHSYYRQNRFARGRFASRSHFSGYGRNRPHNSNWPHSSNGRRPFRPFHYNGRRQNCGPQRPYHERRYNMYWAERQMQRDRDWPDRVAQSDNETAHSIPHPRPFDNFIQLLNWLAALEDQLDSHANRFFNFYRRAQNAEYDNYGSATDMLDDRDNVVFLQYIKEKLVAKLQANLVHGNVAIAMRRAVDGLQQYLDEEPSNAPFPSPSNSRTFVTRVAPQRVCSLFTTTGSRLSAVRSRNTSARSAQGRLGGTNLSFVE